MANRKILYVKDECRSWVAQAIRLNSGNNCLIWPYGNNYHYGTVHYCGRTRLVTNVICEEVYGPRPSPQHEVAHSCGVKLCCNPRHLRWDTPKGNTADKFQHGTNGKKLTAKQVLAIRAQPHRPHRELASEYGICLSTVSHILNRKSWSWLT